MTNQSIIRQPLYKWIPLQPAPRECALLWPAACRCHHRLVDQEKTRGDAVAELAVGHFAGTGDQPHNIHRPDENASAHLILPTTASAPPLPTLLLA